MIDIYQLLITKQSIMNKARTLLFFSYLMFICHSVWSQQCCDKLATKETKNLYRNLMKLKNKGILFGHQDDLAYGIGWNNISGKSDVKEACGDYPAVYGWDLGGIEKDSINLDGVPFSNMRKYIQQGYEQGGVITLSWHLNNPLTGANAWDTTHGAVKAVLEGGGKNELYKLWLNKVAAFILSLKGKNGEYIPVLFRPYHECTGNWFWWCQNTCRKEEFVQLWHFTFNYLTNEKGVHNMLWVYNTAGFETEDNFLERYPGDACVDILSYDDYQFDDPAISDAFVKRVDKKLSIIEKVATEKNKIFALAETGYEAIPYPQWWTNTLWKAINKHSISYVLVWRNHGLQKETGKMHYYAPYKGQVSQKDFQQFYKLPKTLFGKDVKKQSLYQ